MRPVFAIVVVLLTVTAGCSAGSSGESPATDQVDTTPTSTPTPTTTATELPPITLTPEPEVQNPWRKAPIVVATRYENESDREYTARIREAIQFWQTDGAAHPTWEPAFVVRPDAADPDIVVEFKSTIDRCELDHPGTATGCASVLRPDSSPSHPEVIEIVPQETQYQNRELLKHEFGHVLGLRHGDEPIDVMDRSFVPFSRFRAASYDVFVEYPSDFAGEDRSRDQIRHAFDYYEAGAGEWMDANVTFEFTAERADADITITVTRQSPAGSQFDARGRAIYLNGLPHSRHAWHVGYWMGFLFGAEEPADLPPAFDEPQVDDREDWW